MFTANITAKVAAIVSKRTAPITTAERGPHEQKQRSDHDDQCQAYIHRKVLNGLINDFALVIVLIEFHSERPQGDGLIKLLVNSDAHFDHVRAGNIGNTDCNRGLPVDADELGGGLLEAARHRGYIFEVGD